MLIFMKRSFIQGFLVYYYTKNKKFRTFSQKLLEVEMKYSALKKCKIVLYALNNFIQKYSVEIDNKQNNLNKKFQAQL